MKARFSVEAEKKAEMQMKELGLILRSIFGI